MFQGNANGSVFGGLASAIPGDVKGLEYLHHRYGVQTLEPLVGPLG